MKMMYKVLSDVLTINLQSMIDKFASNGCRLHTAAQEHESRSYNDGLTTWVLIFESEDERDSDDAD